MELVLKLFTDCIPVKGYRRSIIYDLGRNKYKLIPNALYDLLKNFDGKAIQEIKNYYKENYPIIEEYIDFLHENEYIFFCKKDELFNFPPLDLMWDYPAEISNAIIEFYPEVKINLEKTLDELYKLGCRDILINFKENTELSYFNSVLSILSNFSYRSIEIYIPYIEGFESFEFHFNDSIRRFVIYNSPYNKIIQSLNKIMGNKIFTTSKNIEYNKISKENFFVNISSFTESQKHNLFFNKKLIISSKGYVYDSIHNKTHRGDLSKESITQILKNKIDTQKWFINKDIIITCKDCEFRYMCIDAREPIKQVNNEWKYETECGYNPYIAKWQGED